MKTDFTVGTANAKPGTKVRGHIEIGLRPDGTMLTIPVVVINGAEEGPTLCLDASTHGDEHEGMVALSELTQEIDAKNVKGNIVATLALNVPAFEAMQRGNPQDVYIWDLNRCYPGRSDGFLTERIANRYLEEVAFKADLAISFHCGANYFYLIEKVAYETELSLELAQALGKDWELLWTGAPFGEGTLLGQCGKRGIPAVAVELGGASGRLPEHFRKNVNTMKNGIYNVMKHYGMMDGTPEYAKEWVVIEEVQVTANNGGLLLPEPDFEFGKIVDKGTTVMRIFDLFGDEVEQIKAPFDGMVVGLRTYPCVHIGDWTLFIGNITRRLTSLAK